jgi:hypothetical protein
VIVTSAAFLALASPAAAAADDLDRFKSEIDRFVARLGPATNGVVKWEGSDPLAIRIEGNTQVAVITDVRLSLSSQEVDRLAFDRVEIRQTGQSEDGKRIELAILLPRAGTLDEADGTHLEIALTGARATAVVDAQSGRGRDIAIDIANARIEQPKTGAWVGFGPLSMTSRLVGEPDGGWSEPVDFETRGVEFSFPQGPSGVIGRAAFSGKSSGPRLEGLERLRDALDMPQTGDRAAPLDRFWATLQESPALFGTIRGEAAVEGLTVRGTTAETLVSLAKTEIATEATGLDGDTATIGFSIREEGLELAPTLLDADRIPRRIVIDLGLGNLSTTALRDLLAAAGPEREDPGVGHTGEPPQATQQLLAAIAKLDPVLRIPQISVDTRDIGVELTGEARGSPLASASKGYAEADLVVRGFDAIPRLGVDFPIAEYLPVLKEMGAEAKAPDGTLRVQFHLASALPRRITVNGNDISAWFAPGPSKPGQPRNLSLSDPPLRGDDVMGVQRALAAAKIAVEQDGVYRSSTAAAVAHFQKEQGLNVDGIVDLVTRQRLGVGDTPR